jgi:hypothetical protein
MRLKYYLQKETMITMLNSLKNKLGMDFLAKELKLPLRVLKHVKAKHFYDRYARVINYRLIELYTRNCK